MAQMTIVQARLWLVRTSLAATSALIAFIVIAPLFGYPMSFADALRVGELVFPVFFGYLGSATTFLLSPGKPSKLEAPLGPLFALLLKGPLLIFVIGTALSLVAFGVTNGRSAAAGTGIPINTLAGIITAFLGLLTITTNALAARLFATRTARGDK
jgi:hypothetical protein